MILFTISDMIMREIADFEIARSGVKNATIPYGAALKLAQKL
jgi:hypothetical protein